MCLQLSMPTFYPGRLWERWWSSLSMSSVSTSLTPNWTDEVKRICGYQNEMSNVSVQNFAWVVSTFLLADKGDGTTDPDMTWTGKPSLSAGRTDGSAVYESLWDISAEGNVGPTVRWERKGIKLDGHFCCEIWTFIFVLEWKLGIWSDRTNMIVKMKVYRDLLLVHVGSVARYSKWPNRAWIGGTCKPEVTLNTEV